jgi:hypothetical protein
MKKITLLIVVIITITASFAATTRWFWYGDTPQISTSQYWDMGTTANWYDPTTVDPLIPFIVPDNFVSGTTAVLDESAIEGSDTLKVSGLFNVDSLIVNNTRTYVLRSKTGYTTDSITGNVFVKDGPGNLVMDCKNKIAGGTILKAGKITMEKQATPNIFGSKLVFSGGIANFAVTTASTYPSVTLPVEIPAGKTGIVELSRYSYWSSPITGSGDLHIYAAGERTYLGQKNVSPNWSKFTGNVLLDKYTATGIVPGFYGLVLNANKTYKDSLVHGFGVDSTFYNRKLTLGTGTAISSESTTRCYAIGELNSVDSTSWVMGYYKSSNGPRIYYMIGGLNTNVVYPGKIAGFNSQTVVGIIKVGTGTYSLTNNNNQISSSVDVREGRLLVNDINLRGNFNGGTGYGVFVKKAGTLGGTGRIAGVVDCYGTLQPGADGIGTLLISDSITAKPFSIYGTPLKYSFKYSNASGVSTTFSFQSGGVRIFDLILREGSVSEFEIANVNSYDKVITTGNVRFNTDAYGAGKPKLKIKLASGAIVNNGDQFELIKAKGIDAANSNGFDIDYPTQSGLTWTVSTKTDTVKVNHETFTFTNHVVTKSTPDSIVTTNVTITDTIKYSYKVIVTAHTNTAVKNLFDKNSISVYPNPAKGNVHFSSSDAEIRSVEVLNLQGQVVTQKEYKANFVSLDIDKLTSGIYYTKVITDKGTKVEKLIVR